MKLVVFGLSVSSSWGNGHATTYRALLKAFAALGHQIDFYEWDAPWYRLQRDLPHPSFCRLHLYDDWGTARDGALAAAREGCAESSSTTRRTGLPWMPPLPFRCSR